MAAERSRPRTGRHRSGAGPRHLERPHHLYRNPACAKTTRGKKAAFLDVLKKANPTLPAQARGSHRRWLRSTLVREFCCFGLISFVGVLFLASLVLHWLDQILVSRVVALLVLAMYSIIKGSAALFSRARISCAERAPSYTVDLSC
jgi:hypothetical protein